MLIENITFLTTFIATSGLAVIGILSSYQQYQTDKNNINQSLLYQQIFLFSFFFYSIWGNLGIRVIVTELTTNKLLIDNLAFFLPLLGVPFLIVSWFMLIKFSFLLRGKLLGRKIIYIYYIGLVIILIIVVILFDRGILGIPENPDLFLLRLFVSANMVIHFLFLSPLLKNVVRSRAQVDRDKWSKSLLMYLGGTIIYTVVVYFSGIYGYLSMAFSLLLMFALSAFLPFVMKYSALNVKSSESKTSESFEAFCVKYQISKREAEIIQEICTGKSNQAIADKLFISLQTVKDHAHRIYTKTEVRSRVQLANLVREKTGKLKTPVQK